MSSHEIIKRITTSLFEPEQRRLTAAKDLLVKRNAEFYRDKPHDGFTYQGKPYDYEHLGRGTRTRVSLHFELIDQMDEFLKDQEQVWGDRYYISQILHNILAPCQDLQDIRDALPNCLVDTLEELRSYNRTRPEAYTIQADKRAVRQYQKVLPRIEFYATARLLY